MFTLVTAEIRNDILSTKQRHDVEEILKTLGISAIKNRNSGNMKISCKSLEEFEKVNKALKEKFNVDTSFVLLNKQATQGTRTRKTQKTVEDVLKTFSLSSCYQCEHFLQ
jgi:dissimilatory sulfite reductase (desulfoviridin) alpha/beta subunit